VELRDREKEFNLCHLYCKAKGWFQKIKEFFQKQFLEEGLRWKGREKVESHKKI
jgi:hypothetical protein